MTRIATSVAIALLLSVPLWIPRLDPYDYTGGRSREETDRMRRNTSAIATVLGELRTSMSDFLFIKTERYLHSGVAYMPHMDDSELRSLSGEADAMEEHQSEVGVDHDHAHDHDHHHDHAHDHDHDHHHHHHEMEAATLIPTAEKDFRGVIGRLHREVKPWRDPNLPHIHTDGTELLPWYRVMTVSDPRNVRAYAIGSWWLKWIDLDQGVGFIEEGIRNNPDSFQLHYMKGRLYIEHARRLAEMEEPPMEEMRRYQRVARDSFETAGRLAIKVRPAEGPDDPRGRWDDYMEDDARGAMRLAVLMEREAGDIERAMALAAEFAEAIGGDARLELYAQGFD